jgi:hypothetical protein
MLVRMWGKKKPSYASSGNVSQYNHYEKQYGGFLKTKHRFAI